MPRKCRRGTRQETAAVIEGHFHRSRMGLQQNVRHADPVAEGGFLARVTRILIAADIEPRPAIEGAFAHPGHKIGHEVVAEAVALVDGAQSSPVPGCTAIPRQLRRPVA
jgi:hypothetical protein